MVVGLIFMTKLSLLTQHTPGLLSICRNCVFLCFCGGVPFSQLASEQGQSANVWSTPRVASQVSVIDVPARSEGRVCNRDTLCPAAEGKWSGATNWKGKICGFSELWCGSAEKTGRTSVLADTGRWMLQARSRAGKPREKRAMCRSMLSEVWALDRPKELFNIKLRHVLKLIGSRRICSKPSREKYLFFFSAVEVKFWNCLSQEVVETDSINLFKKGLDKSMDNKPMKIYWRKGSGRDVCANISNLRNVGLGEGSWIMASHSGSPSWGRQTKGLTEQGTFFCH